MKNTITATIKFSFKGETYTPSIQIELDKHLQASGTLPNLCALIATTNNIDHYSYEYEMMQAERITFSDASGLVAGFLDNDKLDIEAFVAAWHENEIITELLKIAKNNMQVTDFEHNPELKQALLDAYMSGRQQSK